MLKGKKILALIPARGGSKGIKNKNIINLHDKPLISYTINASLKSKYIDETVVTTDSQDIADVSLQYGASIPFLRPKSLAQDTSKTIDAVLHAINELKKSGQKFDILILLQPTQPLRTHIDIDNALEAFMDNNYISLASVSKADDNPILIRTIDKNKNLEKLLNQKSDVRRQDMKDYYRINGCIYINYISNINESTSFNDNKQAFVMDKMHSIDIDDNIDLLFAESIIKNNEGKL